MSVLWWLVPPLLATAAAGVWVGWTGHTHDERAHPIDTDAAMAAIEKALGRPLPVSSPPMARRLPTEPTHAVAVRRLPPPPAGRRPVSR